MSAPSRAIRALPLAALATICGADADAPAPLGAAEVCFTLAAQDCGAFAVAAIDEARSTLLVQAYNFTEPRIVAAIVAAHRRGVVVAVIVDKITARQRGEGVDAVASAGIPTFVDRGPRIAHNKVMVIDGETVLTGSFNWSVSAERYNAENLVALKSPELASFYAENFARRRAASVAYALGAAPGRNAGE
jgi:phosphatidylserine/phosphatidylglycerophosphate/cardiolipin synthase-like enzyme